MGPAREHPCTLVFIKKTASGDYSEVLLDFRDFSFLQLNWTRRLACGIGNQQNIVWSSKVCLAFVSSFCWLGTIQYAISVLTRLATRCKTWREMPWVVGNHDELILPRQNANLSSLLVSIASWYDFFPIWWKPKLRLFLAVTSLGDQF